MRIDYSDSKTKTHMKFDVKYILGMAVLLLSTGMNAQFYVGAQSGIANLQSDVSGTVAGIG
jgi:hypothetical protein